MNLQSIIAKVTDTTNVLVNNTTVSAATAKQTWQAVDAYNKDMVKAQANEAIAALLTAKGITA